MSTIVDLLVGLGIEASEYQAGLDAADKHSSSFVDKLTGNLGPAILSTFAAGGAAVAGFAAYSVDQFANFQGSMNEVFTLLPGMTQDAMGDMTDKVKQFSKDFGVLPDKVVPALYQSLSAGVPPDNVFKFLEAANKAATAGVVDLDVAVNGVSSVVNAYGADIVDASKASDLLFTTVKLGKTTFGELSSSIFNVTPSAAAAGVKFEEVTAALAAMTLQGVPTSVATTKLRAAIDELSKAGTKTDTVFRQVAGKGFKDFLAGGGTMQQALQLLEQHAKDTGVGINDLFGSAEAGSTALLLTGKGTDAFSNALAGMANSAGATDTAFAQMNTGITDAVDDMKASFAVFVLDVGEKLAPFAQILADTLGAALPIVADAILALITPVTDFATAIISAEDPIFEITNALYTFSPLLGDLVGYFLVATTEGDKFNDFFANLPAPVQAAIGVLDQIVSVIEGNLQPILLAIATVIGVVVVSALLSFIATMVVAIAPVLLVIAVLALLYAAYQNNFLGIQNIVTTVMTYVSGFITATLAFVSDFWKANGTDIMAFVTLMFDTVLATATDVLAILQIVITTVLTSINTFWNDHKVQILALTSVLWTMLSNIIKAGTTLISGVIHAFLQLIQGDTAGAWQTIKTMSATFVTQLYTAIEAGWIAIFIMIQIKWKEIYDVIKKALDGISAWVSLTFQTMLQQITSLGAKAAQAASTVGSAIASGIVNGIKSGASKIISAARDAAMDAFNAAKRALGIGSPSKLAATGIGIPFGQGIVIGIDKMRGALSAAGARASDMLFGGADANAPQLGVNAATSASAVGAGAAAQPGMMQQYNVDAHYVRYENETSLRDTLRRESLLNAPMGG